MKQISLISEENFSAIIKNVKVNVQTKIDSQIFLYPRFRKPTFTPNDPFSKFSIHNRVVDRTYKINDGQDNFFAVCVI